MVLLNIHRYSSGLHNRGIVTTGVDVLPHLPVLGLFGSGTAGFIGMNLSRRTF